MSATRLTQLLAAHADGLTTQVLQDFLMNPRTPSIRRLPRAEITERFSALYRNLADWLAKHDDDAVRAAYEAWGRKRFTQVIPLSEIAYSVILAKQHLHRFAQEHGLADLQAVEGLIAEFFDRALYYLIRGYEMQAATPPRESRPIVHPSSPR